MPERFEGAIYLLDGRKGFRAPVVFQFSATDLPHPIVDGEAKEKLSPGDKIENILIEDTELPLFFEREEKSNKASNQPIPPTKLTVSTPVNVN